MWDRSVFPAGSAIGAGAIELAGARAPTPKKKENSDSRGTAAQQNLWGTAPATVRSVPKFLGHQHTPTWYEIGATKFCKGQVGLTVYRIHHAPSGANG